MQGDGSYTWQGDVVHAAQSITYVATLRKDRQSGALTVVVGNVDLPAHVSNGILYVQAPLRFLFEAFAEDFPAQCGDMEVRVSIEGGGSFSLGSDGRPVSSEGLALTGMVYGGRER